MIINLIYGLGGIKKIDDADITDAVDYHLSIDSLVSSHLIDVKTSQGIVTLTGKVNNIISLCSILTTGWKTFV